MAKFKKNYKERVENINQYLKKNYQLSIMEWTNFTYLIAWTNWEYYDGYEDWIMDKIDEWEMDIVAIDDEDNDEIDPFLEWIEYLLEYSNLTI